MKETPNHGQIDIYNFDDTIFKYLINEQLEVLWSNIEVLELDKNIVVYTEGSRPKGVYLVKKGILKIYKTNNEGKEHIIRFAKPNDIIGFRSVISDEPYCTSAKTLEPAVLVFVPASIFISFLKENNLFSLQLVKLSCKELGESNQFITDLALKSLKERLAEVLLILYNNFGTDKDNFLRITLTREDIANMVGTATESIIRQLAELKKENIIDLVGKKIKILDLKKLENLGKQ